MPLNLSRLCTGNPTLLKELSFQEVLELHPLLDARSFQYGTARKTKPIKARPINTILDKSCPTVYESLLLDTLESTQALRPGSMICWGEAGDVWQQTTEKLHAKYDAQSMDADGFVIYTPKEGEDSVMNSFQVIADQNQLGEAGGWAILNPWWGDTRFLDPAEATAALNAAGITLAQPEIVQAGSKDAQKDPSTVGKQKLCLHFGVSTGKKQDWVLQNRKDAADTYRVKESFFNSTYEVETKQG